MKYTFFKILIVFLLVAETINGQAQICFSRPQFPYIYHTWSDISNLVETEWWKPSPYAELIKRKQIKAIHILPAQEYSADSMSFFFSRSAILDSITANIHTWNDSTIMKLHYEFLYNEDQQIKRINYFQDSLLFSFIEIDYKKGLPFFTRQKIPFYKMDETVSIDTVYSWLTIGKNNKLAELYSSNDSIITTDIFKINEKYPRFFWDLPPFKINQEPDTSKFIIQQYSNHSFILFRDSTGKTLSQSCYLYNKEDTLLSTVANFYYSNYDILVDVQLYSFQDNVTDQDDVTVTHPYSCILNEENLPDTIFAYDKIVYHYEYNDYQSRWTPCKNEGKRAVEDWITAFDNASIKPDSAYSKTVRKVFRCGKSIVKAIVGSDTCWFRNDYLVFLENKTEEFWFTGDSVISFINKDGRPVGDIINLSKKAVKKKEYIYQEMKKLFPAFGVRVSLINKEPEANASFYNDGIGVRVSFLILISEDEVDSIKKLVVNNPDFEIYSYTFMPVLPACDFIDWTIDSDQITDNEMRCLKNRGLNRAYFTCTVIDKKTGIKYSLQEFGLRIIRNKN